MASKLLVTFRRQSSLLSPSSTISMPWVNFVRFVDYFDSLNEGWALVGPFQSISRIDAMRNRSKEKTQTLTYLWTEFNDCFCSNWADKIYAFLGIADDTAFSQAFPVNYTSTRFDQYSLLLS